MKDYKLKALEVKDGRQVAKFLVKTGLKTTLFDMMFPKDNPNVPSNWLELRKHLQSAHDMSDADFKAFQKSMNNNIQLAVAQYAGDFPATELDTGKLIIETIIDLFAEDVKYEALIDFLAYMLEVEDKTELEALSLQDAIELVRKMMSDSGFLALLQPSTPESNQAEA